MHSSSVYCVSIGFMIFVYLLELQMNTTISRLGSYSGLPTRFLEVAISTKIYFRNQKAAQAILSALRTKNPSSEIRQYWTAYFSKISGTPLLEFPCTTSVRLLELLAQSHLSKAPPDFELARRVYQKVIQRDPHHLRALYQVAVLSLE